MKKNKFSCIAGIVQIFIISLLFHGCVNEVPSPNFIFFLVDDLGWSDVGCYGSDYYETPNIDRLAKEGMKFTDAYATCCVCSPTRASILTGKYPGRLHITMAIPIDGWQRLGGKTLFKGADYVKNMPLEEITIAEALKEAGYATASMGKWHVAWDKEYNAEYQGFDLNVGGLGMGYPGEYFYPYHGKWRMAPGHPWVEWNTLPDGEPGEYLTDRLTTEAIKFIEENQEQPFFLYLSHYAVHTPIQAKDSLIRKYMEKPADSLRGHIHPKYAAMIESVDQSMGSLLSKLEDLGLEDNTIILFFSDNGGHLKSTRNYPFRGSKANFYEGGIRVPLIIKWPGVTKAGSVSGHPVISNDFYPTMLEMAGLELMPEQHLDGMSLNPLLKGAASIDRDALYWHSPHYSSMCDVVRYHDWKLIESLEDGSVELYDLKSDSLEQHDLANANPGKVQELKSMLADWRQHVNAQMPESNPEYEKKQSGN